MGVLCCKRVCGLSNNKEMLKNEFRFDISIDRETKRLARKK